MNELIREISYLLKEPFRAEGAFFRRGERFRAFFEVRAEGEESGLLLTLFPVNAPPPESPDERLVRLVLLSEVLEALKDNDYHVRCAAANALGQLGEASLGDAFTDEAREALEQAVRDENEWVRREAEKALVAFSAPRVSLKEIEGTEIELEYEEEVQGAVETVFYLLGATRAERKKVKAAVDRFGRTWFPGVPVGAMCRLRVLTGAEEQAVAPVQAPFPALGEIFLRFRMGRALALAAETAQGEEVIGLPYTKEMRLEDGVLLCTVYLDEDGREVVEFRSDSAKMEGRSVRCTILRGPDETPVTLTFLVPLERGYRGILTGRFHLREKLGEGEDEEVKIRFEPEPPLGGAEGQEGGEREQV
jgi:hypothetical protein